MSARAPSELSCQEVVEMVTEFVEGRMAFEERSRFEQHLNYCDPCIQYVQQMRKTVELAGKATAEPPDKDVEQKMVALFRNWKATR